METNGLVPLTKETLEEYISSGKPLLVDFYAEWCGPCQRLLKILPTFASAYEGRVIFGKINVDEEPKLSAEHNVRVVPTFEFYVDKTRVENWGGIKTLLDMKRIIDSHI